MYIKYRAGFEASIVRLVPARRHAKLKDSGNETQLCSPVFALPRQSRAWLHAFEGAKKVHQVIRGGRRQCLHGGPTALIGPLGGLAWRASGKGEDEWGPDACNMARISLTHWPLTPITTQSASLASRNPGSIEQR